MNAFSNRLPFKLAFITLMLLATFSMAYDLLVDIDDGVASAASAIGRTSPRYTGQNFSLSGYDAYLNVTSLLIKSTQGNPTTCNGIVVKIQGDNAGEPNGTTLGWGTIDNNSINIGSFTNVTMNVSPLIQDGVIYWMVGEANTSDGKCGVDLDRYNQAIYYDDGDKYPGHEGIYYDGVAWTSFGAHNTDYRLYLWGLSLAVANTSELIIHQPYNSTFANNSIPYVFHFNNQIFGGGVANQDCGYWLDGSLTWLGSQANNTNITGSLATNLSHHNFTAFCGNGTGGNVTNTVFFTVATHSLNDLTWTRNASELNYYNANASITVNVNETNAVYARFYWNGTSYNQEYSVNASENYSLGYTQFIPLLHVNGSNHDVGLNLTLTYNNGTNQTWSYANGSQTTNYGVYVDNANATPSSVLTGESFVFALANANATGLPTIIAFVDWNASNNSLTWQSTDYFNASTVSPATSVTAIILATPYVNVSYGGATSTRNGTPFNVTVYYLNVTWSSTTCPAGYYTGLNFSFHNEENTTINVSSDMDATFTIYNPARTTNSNVSINATGVLYVLICFTPDTVNFSVDSFQLYTASGYYQRAWFLTNTTVSNYSVQRIYLYHANETLTKETKIVLRDENGIAVQGALITTQRYYPDTNQHLGIAMVNTDSSGEGTTYLTPNDVWYRFIVVKNFVVVESFSSRQVICDPGHTQCVVELQLGGGVIGEYWEYYDQLAVDCSWNHATNLTICVFHDASGVFNNFTLTVTKKGIVEATKVCVESSTASSGTLTCNVTPFGYGDYVYSFAGTGSVVLFGGEGFRLGEIGTFFGTSVAIIAIILLMTIGFAVWIKPEAGVLFFALGFLAVSVMGLLVIDSAAIAAITILALLVAWRLNRS